MADKSSAVMEEVVTKESREVEEQRTRPKQQPRYHVILWDDSEHTYEYVMKMMQELFRMDLAKAFLIADEVDTSGRAICLTTTKEHAELKRDQIKAYGKDPFSRISRGSMSSSIEPEPQS